MIAARARAPPRRPLDGLLPRRDPPLQQGAAGRAAAGGRGRDDHADRRDDREPVLRGQLGAAVARAHLRAQGPLRRRRHDAAPARRSRSLGAEADRRRARLPRRPRRRRRPHRAQRARARRDDAGPDHARRRRGRAAAQGRPLRQGRRPPLRPHLGLDQVDARLRSRRVAALPRRDDRGRRGPALHRPPHGDPGERGHRQRRPARAAASRSPPRAAVEHVGMPECALNLAQAAVYLALAPKSNAVLPGASTRRASGCARTAPVIPPAPLQSARLPGRARRSAAARVTTTRTTIQRGFRARNSCLRRPRDSASFSSPITVRRLIWPSGWRVYARRAAVSRN